MVRGKNQLVLFVDRGGTSTKIWRENGDRHPGGSRDPGRKPIFNKKSKSWIPASAGMTSLSSDYPKLIPSLKKYLQLLPGRPQTAYVGSRGVWTQGEKKVLKKKFSFLGKNIIPMSDIELAHHLVFRGGAGIVLNAGTGSIAYGKNKSGKSARAGGLGPLLGDEGSAFWMGREYLKLKAQNPKEVLKIRLLAKNKEAARKVAALAKRVLQSRNIKSLLIKAAAHNHLKNLVESVKAQLKMKPPVPLHVTGGLFNNPNFRSAFLKQLKGYKPVA